MYITKNSIEVICLKCHFYAKAVLLTDYEQIVNQTFA